MNLQLLATDGIFSTADAGRHGLDKNAIGRLIRQGSCVRLTTGWYGLAESATTPLDLHRLRALACGRQYADRAAISHHSLLVVRRLPTYAARLDRVHLTSTVDPGVGRTRASGRQSSVTVRRPGVVIHRPVDGLIGVADEDVSRPAGMPLAHAIVQAGLLGGPEAALVPADAALRAGLTDREVLVRALTSFAGHTGIGPVRAALPHADPLHESPGETRTAFVLRALGFELEPQVELVVEGRLYHPDFRIRGTRVLIEFDGAVKYDDRRALFAEKQREDALRRAGWVVVRLVWADLADPQRVVGRVRAALALAA